MKNVAAFIFLALISCSKNNPAPYTTIAGDWNIQSNSLNGQVNIFSNSDFNYTTRAGATNKYFTIGTEQFNIGVSDFRLNSKNDVTGLSFSGFNITTSKTILVQLKDGTVNSTFTKISASNYSVTKESCGSNCVTNYAETITFTRYQNP